MISSASLVDAVEGGVLDWAILLPPKHMVLK